MGEAPDIREQEDCPGGWACDYACDQHEGEPHCSEDCPDDCMADHWGEQ